MLNYDWPLYRPPSEARSLIFQATLGCTHNKCAFCINYTNKRYRVKKEAELFAEIDLMARAEPRTRRVFLADGDAFALRPERMVRLLGRLHEKFPALERITAYAGPGNFRGRSHEQLKSVRDAGLSMLYFGLESGDDEVLRRVNKGYTSEQMVTACLKAQDAGFDLSITVILGLAGPKGSQAHALATAKALDRIAPKYASALTLMLEAKNPSYEEAYGDPDFRMLDQGEALAECRLLLETMQADEVIFRSNHASNYVALKGTLQKDKDQLLKTIDRALDDPRSGLIRPEWMRGL